MATTAHTKHRLTWRKRLSRVRLGSVALALVDLFTYTPRVKVPEWAREWRDLAEPTRAALGWIVAYSVVVPGATLLSDLPGKWLGAGIMVAIGGVQFYLVFSGARQQQHAVKQLAQVLERQPAGGPVLCTTVAHCGCLHTFAWNEVAQGWSPVSVVQQPDCSQRVTV